MPSQVAAARQGPVSAPFDKIYGKHAVRGVFLRRPEAVRRLILLAGKLAPPDELLHLAASHRVAPEVYPWSEFLKQAELTQDEKHQGVCVHAAPLTIYRESGLAALANAKIVLALDRITNPQNLATILRSAAFFRVDAVLLLRNRAAAITPVVFRVAVGGAEFVKIFKVTNFARALQTLKNHGFWVYGLDERGETTLEEADFPDKKVLVVGAEDEGLRQRTRQFCDVLVSIPGGQRGIESLNAGVATSIALWELHRR